MKGAANLCGMVELINEEFTDEALKKEVEDRLMPRTKELPLYTTHEFNAKVAAAAGSVEVEFCCSSAPLLVRVSIVSDPDRYP